MAEVLQCVSPRDGSVYVERPLAGPAMVEAAVATARLARSGWAAMPLHERLDRLSAGVDAFVAQGEAIAPEITGQMGRPVAHSPGEVRGYEERARHMLAIAPEALADVAVAPLAGF
ncbi:MAG: aldehyde dehydrogenase family protein, partial [Acidimicrobiales bacterium]